MVGFSEGSGSLKARVSYRLGSCVGSGPLKGTLSRCNKGSTPVLRSPEDGHGRPKPSPSTSNNKYYNK